MARQKLVSLEELVRRYHIVDYAIAAVDLDSGMVLRSGGKLRVVISVAYENTESGAVVIVESAAGLERFAASSLLEVWHMDGEPFIIDLPPEDTGRRVPAAGGGGSSSPAHDAAGIVPVWRGPNKPE